MAGQRKRTARPWKRRTPLNQAKAASDPAGMTLRHTITAFIRSLFLLAGTCLSAATVYADPPRVQAELIAAAGSIEAGVPFSVGLHQRIAPRWHTYWKNPGDSGEPTRISWTMPEGFTASEIRWPVPEAIPVGPLMNFGYSDNVLLPVTITPPEKLDRSTPIEIKARANWLVCEAICIPESAELSLTLPVAPGDVTPMPGEHAALFDATERGIPGPASWYTTFERSADSMTLNVAAPELDPNRVTGVTFFPDEWGVVEHAAPQQVAWSNDGVTLTLKPGELAANDLKSLTGVLVLTEQLGETPVRTGFTVSAQPAGAAGSTDAAGAGVISGGGASTLVDAGALPAAVPISLWQAMLFALLGGAILNLMPCVLPILSLKALALAGHGRGAGHEAARSGFAYLSGVLVSFAVLAAVLIALRSAGLAFGWGFQFQSPVFVLAMASLFLALGLSLSGVFDIGGGAVGVGDGLARKAGATGSFFTGVLASIAATPCTAPFMGVAVGYALTRPAYDLTLVLLAMGSGFALPVLALSLSRTARRLLPKPGPWMDTFKQILAFPLYATVAWLVWVLSLQTGSDGVLVAGITLTAVAFAAWLLGSRAGGPVLRTTLAIAIIAATLAFTSPLLTSASRPNAPAAGASTDVADGEPFSEARVAELRAAGRPVFVNFTAAWCISCKVNEQVALRSDGFRKALTDHNVTYLKGDWTNQDENITRVLRSYGRAGVPLYLLYPADPQSEAIVLPQLLTEAIVVRHFAELNRSQAAIDERKTASP